MDTIIGYLWFSVGHWVTKTLIAFCMQLENWPLEFDKCQFANHKSVKENSVKLINMLALKHEKKIERHFFAQVVFNNLLLIVSSLCSFKWHNCKTSALLIRETSQSLPLY